jgi:2-(1,2-epoxy-1,2-dihydrophenyl)acetyl-CoA isomerase
MPDDSSAAQQESVLVQPRAGYRVITINRPDRMNAMDPPTIHKLIAALSDAEADEGCRAVVLTGAGRGFCAGADLSGRSQTSEPGGNISDTGGSIEKNWNPLARKLANLSIPSVAAVNGVAAGAGANVALGCDIVLAARSARFIQIFSKIGLIPDCGGTFHMPRLVGEGRARALAMLAEPVFAEQAESWGMIWRAVDDASLLEEAEKLAAHLAQQPTFALVLTRKVLRASAANTLDAQLDLERDSQALAAKSPDNKEGVRAFLEKRKPVFTGRGP